MMIQFGLVCLCLGTLITSIIIWSNRRCNEWFERVRPRQNNITIHENLIGNYSYHIAVDDTPLCGRTDTMRRDLRLDSWGVRSNHIGERYCRECEKRAKEKGIL